MIEIGIQDMRDNASRLIRQAEAGETIIITRHRKPVARLGPVEIAVKGEAEHVLKTEAGSDP